MQRARIATAACALGFTASPIGSPASKPLPRFMPLVSLGGIGSISWSCSADRSFHRLSVTLPHVATTTDVRISSQAGGVTQRRLQQDESIVTPFTGDAELRVKLAQRSEDQAYVTATIRFSGGYPHCEPLRPPGLILTSTGR